MTRYFRLLLNNIKARVPMGIARLPGGREQVDVAVLYTLAAALMLVMSAVMLMYGSLQDYRLQKGIATGETALVIPVESKIQAEVKQPNGETPTKHTIPKPPEELKKAEHSEQNATSIAISSKEERLAKPLDGAIIVSYGWQEHPLFKEWRFHPGIDIGASSGTEVLAALSGKIMSVDKEYDSLNVKILSESGLMSIYGNLQTSYVQIGQVVEQGKKIGLTGEKSLTHEKGLHFELWRDNRSIDPQSLMEW